MFNLKKGINLGGWISQCVYETKHYDTFITENDFKRIKDMGFDHVRVPLDYQVIQNEDGSYIEENFKYIDNAISWSKKYSLKMVLDLHKTYGYTFDNDMTFDFFDNEKKKDRFLQSWDVLAKRYSKYSEFVALELLNEVVEKRVVDSWNDLILKAVDIIRKHSKDVYILIGGVCYNSVCYLDKLPLIEGNMIYNFHCYEPIIFTHQGAYWIKGMPQDFRLNYPISASKLLEFCKYLPAENTVIYENSTVEKLDKGFFDEIFKNAISFAKKHNLQLYCGEYGVINLADPKDAINWYKAINACFEKNGIGRAAWSYKKMDFGIIDEHYDGTREELLKYM